MTGLPKGWASLPLGSLVTLNPKTDAPDDKDAGFSPMPRLGTRYRDGVGFEARPWGEIRKSYVHFRDGDVLLAKITPCFENGKAGLVRGMPNGIGAGSSEYFVCRPDTRLLDPRYLLALFKTERFLKDGETLMTGSVGHKRVPKDYLLSAAVPLAPRAEQQRIADKLDSLLARVDTCRDRLDRVPAILKRFRQAVLEFAFSGCLTEEWRTSTVSGQSRNWSTTHIGSLAEVVRGASPRPAGDPRFFGGSFPWITVGELTKDSGKHLLSTATYLTDEGRERSRTVLSGTLLLTNSGATLGVPKITSIDGCINDGSVALLGLAEPTKSFLYWKLRSLTFKLRALNQGAAQPNLNTSIVKSIDVELPSKEEQAEIVRRIESLFALAATIEARYEAAREKVERLTPALLAKAFRGELMPRDPNDEPASELLARLRRQDEGDDTSSPKVGGRRAVHSSTL